MKVTVAMVPRERFSFTQTSLESLYANTSHPFKLVVVDGGSPRSVRNYLRAQAKTRGFDLIRTSYFLSPNEARNLALASSAAENLDAEYIVFVDNDVTFDPDWLTTLVACADETKAWIVGPLYMIGPPGSEKIHMAGGDMTFVDNGGSRSFRESHRLSNESLQDHKHSLRREPVDMVEFHTMLVRRDVFNILGPLDEKLLSANEHIDLCMHAREQNGQVYFEPSSKVTYSPSRPKGRKDLAFHLLRWSPEWNARTLRHFAVKWKLDQDTTMLREQAEWLHRHRLSVYRKKHRKYDALIRPVATWREERKRKKHAPNHANSHGPFSGNLIQDREG